MEQFDNTLRNMAEKEELIVPEGFDERVAAALDGLPPRRAQKGLGVMKGTLIAAAVCALLVSTAFAASPGLRELLGTVLGSFTPYAQEQADQTYTVDGFEVKVLSALTDGSTLRAYAQVRDLEGDRLSADMEPWGSVNVMADDEQGLNIDGTWWSYSFDPGHAVYDPESKTALLVFTSWSQSFGDLKDAKLEIHHIYDYMPMSKIGYEPIPEDELEDAGITVGGSEGEVSVTVLRPLKEFKLNDVKLTIPLTVEAMPKLTFGPDSALGERLGAKLVELSPLGLTVTTERHGGDDVSEALGTADDLWRSPIRVRMKDGAEIDWENPESLNPSGQGTYYIQEQQLYGTISIWNFAQAIDLDQAESLYVCGEYLPLK